MRPERGLFAVRCLETGEMYLEATSDIKGSMNSLKFKLNNGMCRHKALQWAWTRHGEKAFVFEILQIALEDKTMDGSTSEEDLQLLAVLWKEKLEREGVLIFDE
jgi:hypothetical protein